MCILFVGGGTLGSVTPLLAVAEALPREYTIAFWGTRTGPERAIVGAAGIPFRSIPAGKLRRYWDPRNVLDVFIIAWAFVVALVCLMVRRPGVVVGAGSFVQVPVMWAAWLFRIPIVIHQLDVRPSLANRLVALCAQRITSVFPASARAFGRRPVEIIGNPVRQSILAARSIEANTAKHHFGFIGDRPVLFIIGGGTGAQALNDLILGALSQLLEDADVIHGAGLGKHALPPIGRGQGDHYRSFDLLTNDLPYAFAAADLVISRAGMGTITELGCLGKPMVLVPMPGTHQEDNAAMMADAGAAVVWNQCDLTPETFADRALTLVRDRAILGSLGHACAALFPVDASVRLATAITRLR